MKLFLTALAIAILLCILFTVAVFIITVLQEYRKYLKELEDANNGKEY